MNELVLKQKELMDRVPHELRPDSYVKMVSGLKIMGSLLRYLNSTGHKPWRPNPLSPITQQHLLKEIRDNVSELSYIHSTNAGADKDLSANKTFQRQLISGFGIIEESIEYLESVWNGRDDNRPHRLEELTDILFFFLEQMILGEFTWEEVEAEYNRKWQVNINRYEAAEKGDFSWDKRSDKNL